MRAFLTSCLAACGHIHAPCETTVPTSAPVAAVYRTGLGYGTPAGFVVALWANGDIAFAREPGDLLERGHIDPARARAVLASVGERMPLVPTYTALTDGDDYDSVRIAVRTRTGYIAAEVYGYYMGEHQDRLPAYFREAYDDLAFATPAHGTPIAGRFAGEDALEDVLVCPGATHPVR